MKHNPRRASQNNTGNSFVAKLLQGEFDQLAWAESLNFFARRKGAAAPDEVFERPAWQVPVGSGQFVIDVDKLEAGNWVKKDFEKRVAAGTHEYITKEKPDGTTFRTIGEKGIAHTRAIGPQLLR